jgi:hypothetical protein
VANRGSQAKPRGSYCVLRGFVRVRLHAPDCSRRGGLGRGEEKGISPISAKNWTYPLSPLNIGPALLAGTWFGWQRYLEYKRQQEFDEFVELIQTTIVADSGWDEPSQTKTEQPRSLRRGLFGGSRLQSGHVAS